MKKIVFVFIGLLILSGCNTAHGFGRDVERGGQNIQRAAS